MNHNGNLPVQAKPAMQEFFGLQNAREWSDSIFNLLGYAVASAEFAQLPPIYRNNAVFNCRMLANFISQMEQQLEAKSTKD